MGVTGAGTLKLDLIALKCRNPFFSRNAFLHIIEIPKLRNPVSHIDTYSCNDISLSENEISLNCSDILLTRNHISLSGIDILLGEHYLGKYRKCKYQSNIADTTTTTSLFLSLCLIKLVHYEK